MANAWAISYDFPVNVGAELSALLESLGEKMLAWGGGAIFEVGNEIMNESKAIVPFEWGQLKATGTTHPPELIGGNTIVVTLSYGGPSVGYAVAQHETKSYKHDEGQSWKYLEFPVRDAIPTIEPAIAAAIRARIGRESL